MGRIAPESWDGCRVHPSLGTQSMLRAFSALIALVLAAAPAGAAQSVPDPVTPVVDPAAGRADHGPGGGARATAVARRSIGRPSRSSPHGGSSSGSAGSRSRSGSGSSSGTDVPARRRGAARVGPDGPDRHLAGGHRREGSRGAGRDPASRRSARSRGCSACRSTRRASSRRTTCASRPRTSSSSCRRGWSSSPRRPSA